MHLRILIGESGGGIVLFFSFSSSCTCTSNSRFKRSARFSRGKGAPLAAAFCFGYNNWEPVPINHKIIVKISGN